MDERTFLLPARENSRRRGAALAVIAATALVVVVALATSSSGPSVLEQAQSGSVDGVLKQIQTVDPSFQLEDVIPAQEKQQLYPFNLPQIAQDRYRRAQRDRAAQAATDARFGAFTNAWENYEKSGGQGSPPTFMKDEEGEELFPVFNQGRIAQDRYRRSRRTRAEHKAAHSRLGAFTNAWDNYEKSHGSGSPPTFMKDDDAEELFPVFNQARIAKRHYRQARRTRAEHRAAHSRLGAYTHAWDNYEKSHGSGSPPTFMKGDAQVLASNPAKTKVSRREAMKVADDMESSMLSGIDWDPRILNPPRSQLDKLRRKVRSDRKSKAIGKRLVAYSNAWDSLDKQGKHNSKRWQAPTMDV